MVLVAVRELTFRSKIQAAADRLGVDVRFAPRTATLAEALGGGASGTVIVDLTQPGILVEVRALKQAAPVRVVGFLGHLEEDLMRDAADAGVDEVLPRGQFVRRLDDLLRAG
jgi:hypothetical protein